MDLIAEHRPAFPNLQQIAQRAGQDEAAVAEVFGSVQDILDTLAEQGLVKLLDLCLRTVTQAPPDDPVAQFRAIGMAYLNWANDNQAQFRLLQHSKLVDLEGNENLARYVRAMHDVMLRLLGTAKDKGLLAENANIHSMLIAGRCMLFGLARMMIDDNMKEWHPGKSAQDAARQVFSDFVATMAVTTRDQQPEAVSA